MNIDCQHDMDSSFAMNDDPKKHQSTEKGGGIILSNGLHGSQSAIRDQACSALPDLGQSTHDSFVVLQKCWQKVMRTLLLVLLQARYSPYHKWHIGRTV